MIEIILNAVTRDIEETHEITDCVGIQDWIDDQVGHQDRRNSPLFRVSVNGDLLPKYENKLVTPADHVQIIREPRFAAAAAFVSVLSAAYSYYQAKKLNNFDAGSSEPENQNSVYKTNLRANTPRLNGLVKEIFGTFYTYLDYQVKPHLYYDGNNQRVDVALCVGLGEYDIENIFVGETNVDRFPQQFNWQQRGPGQSVKDLIAYQNWYETEAVKNIEIGSESGSTLDDWTGDLSGTSITAYYLTDPTAPPFGVGEVFQITSGTDSGLYRINGISGANNNILTCQKVNYVEPVYASTGYYEDDDTWVGFTTATGVSLEWNTETGGSVEFGPYTLCPDGESTGEGEIDFVLSRGLGTFENDGTISEFTIEIDIQWRTEGAAEWTTIRHAITGATRDELAKTVKVYFNPEPLSLVDVSGSLRDDIAGSIFHAVLTATDSALWDSINVNDVVSPQALDPNIDGTELKVIEIDGTNLVLERVDGESAVEEWSSLGAAEGVLNFVAVRPEIQFLRVTPKSSESTVADELEVERVKVRLSENDSYPWTTIGVSMIGGSEISTSAQNKINALVTRKLPTWDGTTFSTVEATNDIAPVLAYYAKKCNYDYSDLDLDTIGALDAIWKERNDTFAGELNSDLTMMQALEIVLNPGFAKPLVEAGKLTAYREAARTDDEFDYMYTPNQIKGSLRVSGSLEVTSESSGYEVEYFDLETKQTETVVCCYKDQSETNLTKVTLTGCTSQIVAWRVGMRLARERYLAPMTIEYSTEKEALNSGYGSFDIVCGDLAGDAITGSVTAGTTTDLTLDRDVTFGDGDHYIAVSDSMGRVFRSVCTQGASANQVVLSDSLTFTPVYDGTQERPSYSFGSADDFALRTITEKISPNSSSVNVKAREYLDEIYWDDDSI